MVSPKVHVSLDHSLNVSHYNWGLDDGTMPRGYYKIFPWERKKEMARSVKQPAVLLGYVNFGYVIQS